MSQHLICPEFAWRSLCNEDDLEFLIILPSPPESGIPDTLSMSVSCLLPTPPIYVMTVSFRIILEGKRKVFLI